MTRGSTSAPRLVVEERGRVAVIRLNRPAERNPLSAATLDELERAFSSLSARAGVSAVVLTGAGDVFASGADIRELQRLTPDEAAEFSLRGQRLFQTIEDATLPTVAAVNGFCMGGGLDLALACRARCAASSAVFAHPGARLGVITGWGGTQRLPRLIGSARAFEMFATGRRLTAEEAYEFGLVSRVCDPVMECALGLARRLAGVAAES
ncbi:MAG TPA: enoyl-CoA hydratase/isomerase family protein [Pyrinomonadaceae bacterium]|jgi:enoyl-CoA hydratase|nr:enoyl-CoA hydratase/isomerase family protein [Pyrinomonadaceae bacterium]